MELNNAGTGNTNSTSGGGIGVGNGVGNKTAPPPAAVVEELIKSQGRTRTGKRVHRKTHGELLLFCFVCLYIKLVGKFVCFVLVCGVVSFHLVV